MNNQLSLFSNKSNIKLINKEEIKTPSTTQRTLSLTLKLKYKNNNQKNKVFHHYSSIETAMTPSIDETIRKDYYGNEISKKNKEKYKVTFIDIVDKNKNLVEEIPVESYKEFNYEIYKRKSNINDEENICCNESCLIM